MIAISFPPRTSEKFNRILLNNRDAYYSIKSIEEFMELTKKHGDMFDCVHVQFQEELNVYEYELRHTGSEWIIVNKMKRVITWEPVPFDAQ